MLAHSVLQQQVALALRIKQKLGKGLKRSGGAQRVSAQEPTEDFNEDVESIDPVLLLAYVPTDDRTEEAKTKDTVPGEARQNPPTVSQLTELMSVSQLKAELHSRGIDTSLCLEKEELIRRLMQANIHRARSVELDRRVVM